METTIEKTWGAFTKALALASDAENQNSAIKMKVVSVEAFDAEDINATLNTNNYSDGLHIGALHYRAVYEGCQLKATIQHDTISHHWEVQLLLKDYRPAVTLANAKQVLQYLWRHIDIIS